MEEYRENFAKRLSSIFLANSRSTFRFYFLFFIRKLRYLVLEFKISIAVKYY